MPLIQIWNWVMSGPERRPHFREKLRSACLENKELGLTSSFDVTIVYAGEGKPTMEHDPLIIMVEILFEKSERTLEVRRRLAQDLGAVAKTQIEPRPVEVVIKRFDPNTDAFWKG